MLALDTADLWKDVVGGIVWDDAANPACLLGCGPAMMMLLQKER